MKHLIWLAIALLGAVSVGGIALNRGEPVNALWFITAAACTHLIGYRFYSAWIAAKLLTLDAMRPTPAVRFNDGRDYVPTHRWIVFGHHFAAIAGPGPLIGPTLAAQFGYLPGTLWILIGAVLGGCVQDMVIMFCSVRHDGKSLGQLARNTLGRIGGLAAMLGTLSIMVILIAVLALIVVKAMAHSAWATSTVFATIPIAMLVGIYLQFIRIGRVGEGTIIGFSLLLFSIIAGKWVQEHPTLNSVFTMDGVTLAWFVIGYGFTAAVLPVWLLLAPRDYLSTFLKLGTICLLALSIIILRPTIHMPALTQFIDGTGPIVSGTIFPFMFITIACGAISGFHALIASGTTPKLLANEKDIRPVGFGSMALESCVALMAMIAACVLDPGIFFAINSPAGVVGATAHEAVTTITGWGFPVTVETMEQLARDMGENTLFARTGGAPSLAVGMAHILGRAFGKELLSLWYHFAIMFEAVFILTTLDAGTRVARFMLQDFLGTIYPPLGRTSWYPSMFLSSGLVVAAWGYFLYIGVIDPYGGVNILWPLFGIANQMLAAIALCIATAILVTSGRGRYSWVTYTPLLWLVIVTTASSLEKLFSTNPKIGYLAAAHLWTADVTAGILTPEKMIIASKMIFNQYLVAGLSGVFLVILWIVVLDTARVCYTHTIRHKRQTAHDVLSL